MHPQDLFLEREHQKPHTTHHRRLHRRLDVLDPTETRQELDPPAFNRYRISRQTLHRIR